MNILDFLPPRAVIAHRGASVYAPENTLAAFRKAVEQGADAIELDAKLSLDGRVMVCHDQTLERTTNGSGRLASYNSTALQMLDAGSWFSQEFRGEIIPTLEEVLVELGQKTCWFLELTNYRSPTDPLVERVVDLVRRLHLEERVLLISFFPTNLLTARRLLPQTPTGQLALPGIAGAVSRSKMLIHTAPLACLPNDLDCTSNFIADQHTLGRKVFPYTINETYRMVQLYQWGVDGIITNDPPAAQAARGSA